MYFSFRNFLQIFILIILFLFCFRNITCWHWNCLVVTCLSLLNFAKCFKFLFFFFTMSVWMEVLHSLLGHKNSMQSTSPWHLSVTWGFFYLQITCGRLYWVTWYEQPWMIPDLTYYQATKFFFLCFFLVRLNDLNCLVFIQSWGYKWIDTFLKGIGLEWTRLS